MWATLSLCFALAAARRQHQTDVRVTQAELQTENLKTVVDDPDCMTLPGRYHCSVFDHAGACYDPNGGPWACFTDQSVQSEAQCHNQNKKKCLFKDHGKPYPEAEVDECTKFDFFNSQCHAATKDTANWGACYTQGAETQAGWQCILADQKDRFLGRDCLTSQPGGASGDTTFTGLCKLPQGPQKLYKCDTIPFFDATQARTSCEGRNAACFSIVEDGQPWHCGNVGSSVETDPLPPVCSMEPATVDGAHATYFGGCVYDREGSGYAGATDYKTDPDVPHPTPKPKGPTKDCESLPGKFRCPLSSTYGACYTEMDTVSKVSDDDAAGWSCFSKEAPMTDEQCKNIKKVGRCEYSTFGHIKKPADVAACGGLDFYKTQCSPAVGQKTWGACYSEGAEIQTPGWQCVGQVSADLPERDWTDQVTPFLAGNCRTTRVQIEKPTTFTDICKFDQTPQTVYKCETLKTYDTEAGSTQHAASCPPEVQEQGNSAACFSMALGVNWQCVSKDALAPHCASQSYGGNPRAAFSGACIFEKNAGVEDPAWATAKDGSDLPEVAPVTIAPTTKPPPTTAKPTTKPGSPTVAPGGPTKKPGHNSAHRGAGLLASSVGIALGFFHLFM